MAMTALLTPFCFSSPPSSSTSSSTRHSFSILPLHTISSSSLSHFTYFSSSHQPLPSTINRRKPHNNASSSRALAVATSERKKVLIINTDGGAHAAIGFYFAKELLGKGHKVTIFTVGDETSDNMKNLPFSRFSEIVDVGGKTVWGDPGDVGKVLGGEGFDVVLDNNSKDIDTVRPVVDWAKSSGTTQFLYISSAGIYKPTDEPPHIEGDVVKSDASHVGAEEYVSKVFSNWAIFRPQYVIGSAKHKDCEEWFFDRIVRGRPVPIPGSGIELTNLAHLRDLSSMLTLAVENPTTANGNIFNCVSDRAITLDGMARLCAQAAGLPLKTVHYDPKAVGVDAKKAFPFRSMHFYAEPRAAKDILGWQCTTNLPEDLKERFEEYVRIGRDKVPLQFEIDDKILESLNVPAAV